MSDFDERNLGQVEGFVLSHEDHVERVESFLEGWNEFVDLVYDFHLGVVVKWHCEVQSVFTKVSRFDLAT